MLVLRLTLLFLLNLSAEGGPKVKFVERSKGCIFNYKNANNLNETTTGILYDVPNTGFRRLCCAPSFTASSFTIDFYKREKNCCSIDGYVADYGPRPCPGEMLLTPFKDNGPDFVKAEPKSELKGSYPPFGDHSLCPTSTKSRLDTYVAIIDKYNHYKLVPVVEPTKCKDPKKPFRVKFLGVAKNGYMKYAYSWCCSKDVFSDYRLDPKKVCCGLSGAQSPFQANNGFVQPDNPPCCRHVNSLSYSGAKQPCEPFVIGRTPRAHYRTCPPISGLHDITPNLDETVPALGPYSYSFGTKPTSSGDLSTQSTCIHNQSKIDLFPKYKYFYSMSNMYDRLTQKNKGDRYGLCCSSENMFAHEVKEIARSCCITFTNASVIDFGPEKLPCKAEDTPVSKNHFTFPPCKKYTCVRPGNLFDGIPVYVRVEKSKDPNLYGSSAFFASKNVIQNVTFSLS